MHVPSRSDHMWSRSHPPTSNPDPPLTNQAEDFPLSLSFPSVTQKPLGVVQGLKEVMNGKS